MHLYRFMYVLSKIKIFDNSWAFPFLYFKCFSNLESIFQWNWNSSLSIYRYTKNLTEKKWKLKLCFFLSIARYLPSVVSFSKIKGFSLLVFFVYLLSSEILKDPRQIRLTKFDQWASRYLFARVYWNTLQISPKRE